MGEKTILVSLLGATWATGLFRIFLCGRNLIVAYIMVDMPPQFKGLKRKIRRRGREETTVFQNLRSSTIEWSVIQGLNKLVQMTYASIGLSAGFFPFLWRLTGGLSDSIAVRLATHYALDGLMSRTLTMLITVLTNFLGLGHDLDSKLIPTKGQSVHSIICGTICLTELALTVSYAPEKLRWILLPTAAIIARLTDTLMWNLEMMYWRRTQLEPLHDKNIIALAAEVGFPKDNMYLDRTLTGYPVANYCSVFGQHWIVVCYEMIDILNDNREDCIVTHELGHWKYRWSIATLLIRFIFPLAETIGLGCLCTVAYGNLQLLEAFGFEENTHPLIPMYLAYSYTWPVIASVFHHLKMLIKRQCVFAADDFVLQREGLKSIADMKTALFLVAGLAVKYPIFDKWYSALILGEPTILERLSHVDVDDYLNIIKKEGVDELNKFI